MITLSYTLDIGMVLVRIFTRDRYTLESATNFPLLSLSLREFWGQRCNQYINTVLKESIFQPIRLEYLSSSLAGFVTFIISGLMHVHIAYIVFDDTSTLFPTFLFFFWHGIACFLEANTNLQYTEHVRWLLTQAFLLITAPLLLKPFIINESKFHKIHPLPLLDAPWIPQLPVPKFCP